MGVCYLIVHTWGPLCFSCRAWLRGRDPRGRAPRLLLTLPGGQKRGLQTAGNTTFLPAQAQRLVQRMDDMTLGNAGQHTV